MADWVQEGPQFVERSERAYYSHRFTMIGETVKGAPIEAFVPSEWGENRILVLASIHGEEPEAAHVLSFALRTLQPDAVRCAVITCANPDGVARGTRGNANNVDLNRNWPSSNWAPDLTATRWETDLPRDTWLSPGDAPASEPETQALIKFIADHEISHIISMHAPLACVDYGQDIEWPLVDRLSTELELPKVGEIGYFTPGSMGTWAAEKNIPIITLEMEEDLSLKQLRWKYGPVLHKVLLGE